MSLENLSEDQIRSLASLAKDLSDDPATRRSFQKLIKQKNPSTVFPEVEIDDRAEQLSAKISEETESLRAELKQRDIEQQRRDIKANLADKYPGISFEDIEKTMVESAIGKHETAAQFLANQKILAEPAAEVPGRGGPMMMPSEARQFFKSPSQVSRKLAHEVVTDLINKRARGRVGAV
jgi:hypothetical protein